MTERALVVVRLSHLTEVSTSPDSQQSRCTAKAEQLGMDVVGVAEDLDITAVRFGPWDRPALGSWLTDHAGEFDAMIFRSVDRVARSIHDFVQLNKWATENGKRLICLDPEVDFASMIGQMLGVLLAWFGQMEADTIRKRVVDARAYMRSVARWGAGRLPYGYRLVAHPSGSGFALEPDPDLARRVRDIVSRYMSGETLLGISRDLNERGVLSPDEEIRKRQGRPRKPRRGSQINGPALWHPRTIDLILRSPSLRNVVHHRGRIQRHPDGKPLRYGEGILTDDEFAELQDEMARRNAGQSRSRRKVAPLLGVLVCAECGFRLYRNAARTSRKNPESQSRTYRCISSYRGVADCSGTSIGADDAMAYVERELLKHIGDREVLVPVDDPGEDHSEEIRDVKDALHELEADRYEGGLFRGDEGRQRFREQYGRLEQRLSELESLPQRPGGTRLVATGQTYTDAWADTANDTEARRHMLLDAGVRVVVRGRIGDGGSVEERATFSIGDPSGVVTEGVAGAASDEPVGWDYNAD